MLSVSAKLRKKLGKEIGDLVTVYLSERLTWLATRHGFGHRGTAGKVAG